MMNPLPDAQLAHVGLFVRDLEAMIAFYTRVLGLVVTDSGDYYLGGRIAFLSRNPEEHHQVVMASGRPKDAPTTINQLSFRVKNLEDLKRFFTVLVAEKAKEIVPRNHGNAWSIYFSDPEDNRIELYTPSPWYVGQPYGKPLDLTEPVEAIVAKTEALIQDDPTACPREAWMAKLKTRLAP
jgi:catechol 2,3-dioxygenase-like lactoylglutathione lyase family enzyme